MNETACHNTGLQRPLLATQCVSVQKETPHRQGEPTCNLPGQRSAPTASRPALPAAV